MSALGAHLDPPVLVVGGYGYRNVGDEAILAGLLARLAPDRVTVVSRDPAHTAERHGVRAIGIGGAAPALLRHRSVVIGGGGLFGRDMGRIGRLLPVFGLAAAAMGRTVVVEGVDVDGRLAPAGGRLVPRLLRAARHVTVRDRPSLALARAWGVRANLAPDLSSWMPMAPVTEGRALLRGAGVDTRRPVVGLALTGVEPRAATAALGAVDAVMTRHPDLQFCFIPMSRHPHVPTHDDLHLANALRGRQPRLAVVEAEAHPSVVLAAVSQLSAIVAMRYHAMLFADRAGVPLVPISYAEKNLRWLADHDLAPVEASAVAVDGALTAALARDQRIAS